MQQKKKQQQIQGYNLAKSYELVEGIQKLKDIKRTNFDASVDIAINLGVDIKNPLHMVRSIVLLPHGTGKVPSVLAICKTDKEEEAKQAGADYVGLDEYIDKISKGWTKVDVIVTTPDLMVRLGKLGKVLGPANLMPNVKTGTVTQDIGKAIASIKKGKITIKTEKKGGIIHTSVGRISFSPQKIKENILEVIHAVIKAKHSTVKGNYLQKVTLSSTMSPGVNINLNTIK